MYTDNPIALPYTGEYALVDSVALAAGASFVHDVRVGQDTQRPVLDLAFVLEGSWHTVGVRVDQQADGKVLARVGANPDGATTDEIGAQLGQIFCLTTDGIAFAELAARDEVLGRLRQQRPGVRPVLYPSPYEAAARTIIGHQLPLRQAAAIAARIAEEHGVAVEVFDHQMHAFPAPERLAGLPAIRGLAARKVEQLRALGKASGDWLSRSRLLAMDREAALAVLRELPGIGPFSAELVLLRGAGDPNAFPRSEKRLHRAMAEAYHLGDEPTLEALEEIADGWRPYRSWAGLLLRNAINRSP